jgi:hypothetical protein
MVMHLQLYDSNWQQLRLVNGNINDPAIADLSFPATIPFPLEIYGATSIQYDWELLVEVFLDSNISNYRTRISNPNEVDYGYINARSNSYIRERTQIHAELQQLCGASRNYNFPTSDVNQPAKYSNTQIPEIFGANNHEFVMCTDPPGVFNPTGIFIANQQLNIKIKDFALEMKPIARPIEDLATIEISPSTEQEIDQFSFFLRPGVVGRTRLIVRLRTQELAVQFGSAHAYNIGRENGGYQPACGSGITTYTGPQFAAILPPQTICPDPCTPTPPPCTAAPGFEYCCADPTQPGCAIP